ncbi:prepilin peptidase [Virgibacillus dokdonensis]|uniref:prepilin peptidase n=1 Tax=Virgibacillus dokdonensis TaxID=302167 RepID=UPI0020CA1528|nr:A24 family peptidase [Virgibacillus dokdonensis]
MIEAMLIVYLFIVGLVFGSFFNVVGLRLVNDQSIISPRSHCPQCNHQLTAAELIPVVSFLMQRGRCKSCHIPISLQYPFVEALTAILFAITPLRIGWSNELFIAYLLIALLITVSIADIDRLVIPNRLLLFFASILFIIRLFIPTSPWWDSYLGAILGFLLLFLIQLFSKGAMGGGDIKLFAVLGLFIGVQGVLWTLFLASLFGVLYGVVQMIRKRRKRKEPLPFAPFISVAAFLYFLFPETWSKLLQQFLVGQ